jgi:hypothetical protein
MLDHLYTQTNRSTSFVIPFPRAATMRRLCVFEFGGSIRCMKRNRFGMTSGRGQDNAIRTSIGWTTYKVYSILPFWLTSSVAFAAQLWCLLTQIIRESLCEQCFRFIVRLAVMDVDNAIQNGNCSEASRLSINAMSRCICDIASLLLIVCSHMKCRAPSPTFI